MSFLKRLFSKPAPPVDPNAEFFALARNKDLVSHEQILSSPMVWLAVMAELREGYTKVVDQAISLEFDINQGKIPNGPKNALTTSPLCLAVYDGEFDMVQRLINHGADVDAHDGSAMRVARMHPYDRPDMPQIMALLEKHSTVKKPYDGYTEAQRQILERNDRITSGILLQRAMGVHDDPFETDKRPFDRIIDSTIFELRQFGMRNATIDDVRAYVPFALDGMSTKQYATVKSVAMDQLRIRLTPVPFRTKEWMNDKAAFNPFPQQQRYYVSKGQQGNMFADLLDDITDIFED
ncbi:ankyrin repeat domain-containing protein [Pseudoxanthomonas winnipegensis]|uniref:Ankyrin repeat domain-containing protein n=1 Tax=Pseudoxanthomonas winnipegensis TaxID=2480810 RepID=A0A4Q8M4Y7_9GAMM|nr:ankyrin repeat domain-containing protein [Pseudoxanthomonas winnipegensis]TAA41554.1 ankyrin repeat domain-containing protein [Pseudoxanthomonas winnipegensis]